MPLRNATLILFLGILASLGAGCSDDFVMEPVNFKVYVPANQVNQEWVMSFKERCKKHASVDGEVLVRSGHKHYFDQDAKYKQLFPTKYKNFVRPPLVTSSSYIVFSFKARILEYRTILGELFDDDDIEVKDKYNFVTYELMEMGMGIEFTVQGSVADGCELYIDTGGGFKFKPYSGTSFVHKFRLRRGQKHVYVKMVRKGKVIKLTRYNIRKKTSDDITETQYEKEAGHDKKK